MLDALTLFRVALLLVSIYIISKFILYVIKLIRGMGRTEIASGRINFVRAVSRRCVQFQFADDTRIYEMYSEESWVLYKHDEVRVAGYIDHTGKFIALAYDNTTKSVYGHARLTHLPWLLVMGSVYVMGTMIYFQFYDYFLIAMGALIYGLIIIQPDIDVRRSIYLLSKQHI